MFGSTSAPTFSFSGGNHNSMKDIEVTAPPEDTVSCLEFGPENLPNTYLIAGSWASDLRMWEIQQNGQTIPKAQQMFGGPILDACWSQDGSKVFAASCDKTAKMWDLQSNQVVQIAQHDAAIKSIHWVQRQNYQCVMTGSWDKTLKFWDTRSPTPLKTFTLPERIFCADVLGPMAVVSTANRGIYIYNLDNEPQEFKQVESLLKFQHRCIAIFTDKAGGQPAGFAIGSIEGRVAIHYINPANPRDNFTFKCHRSQQPTNGYQDIFAVNDIGFHPQYGTLATCGGDGRFSFWDKDARTKLKTSEVIDDQAITCCDFDPKGNIFAYATGYDWSKGHEGYNSQKKNFIYLRPAVEELKPRKK